MPTLISQKLLGSLIYSSRCRIPKTAKNLNNLVIKHRVQLYSNKAGSGQRPPWFPTRLPFKLPLFLAAIVSFGVLSYNYFLPNIAGFPAISKKHIRKALWARDKEHDNSKAIFHFKKAIEDMHLNLSDSLPWHLVGTISELVELLVLEHEYLEAISYYNDAIEVLFGKGFDSPDKIKRRAKTLPYKTKNKLVVIKLELAQLYHKLDDFSNEKKSLDDAVLFIFSEAFHVDQKTDYFSESRLKKLSLPRWLSSEDFVSTLGQVADFYQAQDNPRYAIPLYQVAAHFCTEASKRAIVLCNLGSTYYSLEAYDKAITSFSEGLASLREQKMHQAEFLSAKATILFNLSMTYEAQRDFEDSLKVFGQLWDLRESLSDFLTSEKWALVQSRVSHNRPNPESIGTST